jgi:hypothetical protein
VAAMMARKTIDEFERAAEAAYAAMYGATPYSVKDCYDDAQLYFSHAIAAAKHAGLADEVERLSQRADDIRRVYNSQFRGVGQ